MLQDLNDYLSNPKCNEWHDRFSLYRHSVTYQWEHVPTGTTGQRTIRVKQIAHAHTIVNHWNAIQGIWKYTILGV